MISDAPPTTADEICALLDARGIAYQRVDHAPVFTCEQTATEIPASVPGVQTKNLFMRDKRGRSHWLLVTDCATPVDMKALAPRIGADHLSLASPDRLLRHLGVTPGAVTVLGLVHDRAHAVTLLVDAAVWRAESIRAHPLDNAATLVLAHDQLERFLALTGHRARIVDVP